MDHHLRALILHSFIQKINCTIIFFHPDCTVGPGISPDHASRLAGFTAGREFHPALKNMVFGFAMGKSGSPLTLGTV